MYHPGEEFENRIEEKSRFQREPVSLTLAVLLGVGVAARARTRAAALIQGSKQMAQLQNAVDQDLRAIETLIAALQDSLTSLSEVVFQNRHGLDLLFMKEGGLCTALKEECCFYADYQG